MIFVSVWGFLKSHSNIFKKPCLFGTHYFINLKPLKSMMARLADCKDFLQTINIVSQFFSVLLLGPSHLSSTWALLLDEHKGSRWQAGVLIPYVHVLKRYKTSVDDRRCVNRTFKIKYVTVSTFEYIRPRVQCLHGLHSMIGTRPPTSDIGNRLPAIKISSVWHELNVYRRP